MPHSTKKKKKRFRANIDQQDSEFAEEFKETCQLNGAKRTLSRLIPAIVEQIDDKAHNRTGFDLHDRPQFHQNLESYLAQMMPHHSLTIFDDEQNPFRYLMRKSIEICIEGYQDKRRKNGDDYAIYHPTGLARGIDSLLKDKDLPTYYVMAAIKGALFHDFGEDIYFKPRVQDGRRRFASPLDVVLTTDTKRILDPLRFADRHKEDIERVILLSSAVNAALTKLPYQGWWPYHANLFQEQELPESFLERVRNVFSSEDQFRKQAHSLILTIKSNDVGYNNFDLPNLVPNKDPLIPLDSRAEFQFKAIVHYASIKAHSTHPQFLLLPEEQQELIQQLAKTGIIFAANQQNALLDYIKITHGLSREERETDRELKEYDTIYGGYERPTMRHRKQKKFKQKRAIFEQKYGGQFRDMKLRLDVTSRTKRARVEKGDHYILDLNNPDTLQTHCLSFQRLIHLLLQGSPTYATRFSSFYTPQSANGQV